MKPSVEGFSSLNAFVLAAETRSFKAAARAMGITSSAVGKSIGKLEARLAVQLFHRTTRTISLTNEGALFLVRARNILEEMEIAEAELASETEEPRGRLKVGLPVNGSFLVTPLAAFMRLHPRVHLEIDVSDRLVDVVDEGFDIVIRTGRPADSRLMHRKLGDFDWHLAASPDYLDRAGTPLSAGDLAGHRCLRQRFSTGRLAQWTFRDGAEVDVPVAMTANSIDPLLDMACAGAGIGAFPKILIHRHLQDGRLSEVLPGTLANTGTLNVLWPAAKYRAPRTRAFIDFVTGWARGQGSVFSADRP